ncbi:acetyltransferase [Pseudomonas aeruginosa]|uniref:acetyltransferase n=1 Tax=Pseudomonas aeruginosa TaxID=287 RepID=UPI0003BB263A|nr:acetyltransferase [Pseudomonas aeruginosa]ERY97317.1 hypothetical protein Q023_00768 [Pseudomonas aeruginosa BWHPSA010]
MDLYGIVGAGGFGREVIPLANKNLRMVSQGNFRLVFIDDGDVAKNVNGYDVLTTEKFLAQKAGERFFNIAIGNSRIREKVCNILLDGGARPFSISASNAVVLDGNELAEGSILCPFSMVTSNTRIGKFFHANIYSYVAHDCEIGDFVTFAPSVKCNGNVRIESHAYIGTGAVIKHGNAGASNSDRRRCRGGNGSCGYEKRTGRCRGGWQSGEAAGAQGSGGVSQVEGQSSYP